MPFPPDKVKARTCLVRACGFARERARLPCVTRAVGEAEGGIVLCDYEITLSWFQLRFNPSGAAEPRHLPLHKGGFDAVPVKQRFTREAWGLYL